MAQYYVQKFSYDGGDSLAYGEMGAHDHDQASQFTVDVTAYLTTSGCRNIVPGTFRSSQPEPKDGKSFNWNGKKWIKS